MKIPTNTLLVSLDDNSAYHILPQDDGSECLREALDERREKEVPTEFLGSQMDLIQKFNIFEFHDGQLWKKLIVVALGIHPAPSFANIYLARRIDRKIEKLGEKYGKDYKSAFFYLKDFCMT